MDTKAEIIRISDSLIREKGFNAFSFSDISRQLNIRNASIHYHFPTKTALGVAVINEHLAQLDNLIKANAGKDPLKKLNAFWRPILMQKAKIRSAWWAHWLQTYTR